MVLPTWINCSTMEATSTFRTYPIQRWHCPGISPCGTRACFSTLRPPLTGRMLLVHSPCTEAVSTLVRRRSLVRESGPMCLASNVASLRIAIVTFDGAEELDIFGPYQVFWWQTIFQHLPPDQASSEDEYEQTFLPRSRPERLHGRAWHFKALGSLFWISACFTVQLSKCSRGKHRHGPRRSWSSQVGGAQTGWDDRLHCSSRQQSKQQISHLTVCIGAFLVGALACSTAIIDRSPTRYTDPLSKRTPRRGSTRVRR